MAHCGAVARMLRASGRFGHADKLESALDEAARILRNEVGPEALDAARAWASDEMADPGETPPSITH